MFSYSLYYTSQLICKIVYTIERIHMSGQIRLFSPYQRQNKEHFNEDKI